MRYDVHLPAEPGGSCDVEHAVRVAADSCLPKSAPGPPGKTYRNIRERRRAERVSHDAENVTCRISRQIDHGRVRAFIHFNLVKAWCAFEIHQSNSVRVLSLHINQDELGQRIL